MVQMIPNSALITAVVESIRSYPQQEGYRILTLNVKTASPNGEKRFLYNKKEDENMNVLVGDTEYVNMRIQVGGKIHVEARKVSPKLWRVIGFL